jgi:VCBS repeat protein
MLKRPMPNAGPPALVSIIAPALLGLCIAASAQAEPAADATSPDARLSALGAAPLFDLPYLLDRSRAERVRAPLAMPRNVRFAAANVRTLRGADGGADFAPSSLHFRNCCFATSLTTADLRGDGRTDIISGNGLSYDVTVLLADGAGGYADPVSLPMTSLDRGIVFVATGDVDGDGYADIAATGFDATTVLRFAGAGDGSFGAPASFDIAGSGPWGVALADIDGNGTLDIVTANNDTADVSVLAGDGSGNFAAAVDFPAGAFPIAVAIADVNGDGHPDIVTANAGSTDVSVLAGDGPGNFAAPEVVSIGADAEPRALAVGDLDGDGEVDIVTANATLDGSDFPPPELPGSVSIMIGDGSGGFAPAVQRSTGAGEGRADGVVIADITGDGRADLVVSRPNANSAAVLIADGAGGFGDAVLFPVGIGPSPIAVADATGDGHPDILTGNQVGSNVSVLPGDGAGGIGFDGNFGVGAYPHSIVAVDLDGDGQADFATANAISNDVSVRFGDGAGGFAPEAHYAVGNSPTSIASGDFNEDGHPDLVAADLGGGEVSILLNDGAGRFGAATSFGVGGDFQSPYAVAVGDANGDGHLDIATADTNVSNESISLLLGDGTGHFGEAVLLPLGAGKHTPQGIVLTDVTGDGNADIVTANLYSSDLSLLVGDGVGNFAAPVSLPTDLGPVVVAAADVDGDGAIDLVTVNQTAQTASVLIGDGSGGFAAPANYAIYPPEDVMDYMPWPWGMTLADINLDGMLDIVTANTQNDTVSVLPNDGFGHFDAYFNFDTGAHPGSVAVADTNGDGAPDIVTANRDNNGISVLRNEGVTLPDEIFADGFDIIPI